MYIQILKFLKLGNAIYPTPLICMLGIGQLYSLSTKSQHNLLRMFRVKISYS